MIKMKYKLGEIFEVGSGGTPSKSHPEYYGGSIPWIKTGDLKCKYLYEAEDYITESGLSNSSAKMYETDTVLIAMYGATIGATSILKIDACTNQACAAFKKSEIVLPEYLYYFFKSQKERFVKDGVGGAQPNISAGYLKNVEMDVPELNRQTEIADILDKVNRVIDQRKLELEELDNLIKSRFVELFGDVRREEKYPGIPLRKLCSTISGGTPSTKFPEYYEGEIPWISTVSLGPNHIDGSTAKGYVTEEAIENSATKLIPAGNLLFGTRVGVGKSSLNDVDICTNQDIVAIVGIDETKNSKLFIKHVLDAYQPYFDSIKKGATILGITGEDLKDSLIPEVPIEVQKEYEKFVEQVDKLKFEVKKSLDEMQQLMDSLMQKYFG